MPLPMVWSGYPVNQAPMNCVARHLWVGGEAALDVRQLAKHDIRHVVNCASELVEKCNALIVHGVDVRNVPLNDTMQQVIVPFPPELDAALCHIDECLARNEPVLVNCYMGQSRSVSVVIAYLIAYRGLSYAAAYSTVRQHRPTANPNPSFQRQLRLLGAHLHPESAAGGLEMEQCPKAGRRQRLRALLGLA